MAVTLNQSWFARLWPKATNAPRLKEREVPVPFLARLITVVTSLSALFLFGHDDVIALAEPLLAARILAMVMLCIIILGVYAADINVVRSFIRLPVLWFRGDYAMFAEHVAYICFVMSVNAVTLFLVLRAPVAVIVSGRSIIPDGWLTFIEVLKAGLLAWTTLQTLITSSPLPVTWSTLLNEAAELFGGKAQEWLRGINVDDTKPATIFSAYTNVLDGLRHRNARHDPHAAQQRDQIIRAIEEVAQTKDSEMTALRERYEREIAELTERIDVANTAALSAQSQADTDRNAAISLAESTARRQVLSALVAIISQGMIPDWVTDAYPELAGMPLAIAKKGPAKRAGSGVLLTEKASGTADDLRALLDTLGVKPVKTPEGKKGIWVLSTDIQGLSGGMIVNGRQTEIAKRLGEGRKSGVSNICPLNALLRELGPDRRLHVVLQDWWDRQQSADDPAHLPGDTSEMAVLLVE